MKKRYELDGVVVARNLYGVDGFIHLLIKTDENGLKEIMKEPRQDYVEYGGIDVLYACFDVYQIDVLENEKFRIERFHKEPFTIEDGKIPDDIDEEEAWLSEPNEIAY